MEIRKQKDMEQMNQKTIPCMKLLYMRYVAEYHHIFLLLRAHHLLLWYHLFLVHLFCHLCFSQFHYTYFLVHLTFIILALFLQLYCLMSTMKNFEAFF